MLVLRRKALIDVLLDALRGTTVSAVPLAERIIQLDRDGLSDERLVLESLSQTASVGGDITINGVLYRPFDYALGWRR